MIDEKSWNVVAIPYDPRWPEVFEKEAAALSGIFGDLLIQVQHVGSTAIPGIYSKPVIDILPVVRDICLVDSFNEQMLELGYVAMGEYGNAGRRFFFKGGKNRTHNVHFFQEGHPEILRHLRFRDFLLSHLKEAQEYSQLKQQLALRFPTDIESYCNGKSAFVKAIDHRAALEIKTSNCE